METLSDRENDLCIEFSAKENNPEQEYEEEFWTEFEPKQKKVLPLISKKSAKHSRRTHMKLEQAEFESRVLSGSRSVGNLRGSRSRDRLDRRPRKIGWGFQNTTVEDMQERMHQVKKDTAKTNKQNVKLKCKIRRLEREIKKKDKTVQSLIAMAMDERELSSCELMSMLQQSQTEAMSLKKENTSLRKTVSESEVIIHKLEAISAPSHVNGLEKRVAEFTEELMDLQRLLHEKTSRIHALESKVRSERCSGKQLAKDVHALKKALAHEKRKSKSSTKLVEEKHAIMKELKTKLATAEMRLEENLQTVATLKNKMSRFERSMRKQMQGSQRKTYYDIEKDMDKLRRDTDILKRQKEQFKEILAKIGTDAKSETIQTLCNNIGEWLDLCRSNVETDDVAFHVGQYMVELCTVKQNVDAVAPQESCNLCPEEQPNADCTVSVQESCDLLTEEAEKKVSILSEPQESCDPLPEEVATSETEKAVKEKATEVVEQKKSLNQDEAATVIQKNWRKHHQKAQSKIMEKSNEAQVDENEDDAARVIQRSWKKHHEKVESKKQNEAASTIQKEWRKHQKGKEEPTGKVNEKTESGLTEDEAALRIQKEWRNHKQKATIKSDAASGSDGLTDDQALLSEDEAAIRIQKEWRQCKQRKKEQNQKDEHIDKEKSKEAEKRTEIIEKEDSHKGSNAQKNIDKRKISDEEITTVQSFLRAKSPEIHRLQDEKQENIKKVQNLIRAKSPEIERPILQKADEIKAQKPSEKSTSSIKTESRTNPSEQKKEVNSTRKAKHTEEDVKIIQNVLRAKSPEIHRLQANNKELPKKETTPGDSQITNSENVTLVQSMIRAKSPELNRPSESDLKAKRESDVVLVQNVLRSRSPELFHPEPQVKAENSATSSDKKKEETHSESNAKKGGSDDVTLVQSMIRAKSPELHKPHPKQQEDITLVQNIIRSRSPEFVPPEVQEKDQKSANNVQKKPKSDEKKDISQDVTLVQSMVRAKSPDLQKLNEMQKKQQEDVMLVQNIIRSRSPEFVPPAVKEQDRERHS